LGMMLADVGELHAAMDALDTSRQYLLGSGAANSEEYLQVVLKLGSTHNLLGNIAAAKAHYAEVMQRGSALGEPSRTLIDAQISWAEIARREGQLQSARTNVTAAAAAAKKLFGTQSDAYQRAQEILLRVSHDLDDASARSAITAAAVPGESSDPTEELLQRSYDATRAIERGDYALAAAEFQLLAPAMRERHGTSDPNSILTYGWLSIALLQSGRIVEADAALNQALDWARGASLPDVRANVEVITARHFLRSGRWEQAVPFIRSALAHIESTTSMRPFVERVRGLEGEMLLRSGRIPKAREVLQQAHDGQLKLNGKPTRDTGFLIALQAIALDMANGPAAAIPLYEQSHKLVKQFMAAAHPDIVKMQLLLDYARWRAAPAVATQATLRASATAFADTRAKRADVASVRTLTQELANSLEPSAVRSNLFAVLDH
jgi:hypothetical protein